MDAKKQKYCKWCGCPTPRRYWEHRCVQAMSLKLSAYAGSKTWLSADSYERASLEARELLRRETEKLWNFNSVD